MISMYKRPPAIVLSNNPAWFEVSNTGEDKMVKAVVSSGGQEITSLYSFASVNNRAFFEFSEVFSSVLDGSYNTNVMHGTIAAMAMGNLAKTFTITFSDSLDHEITEQITALTGSLSPDLLEGLNYGGMSFYDLLEQDPFLTLRPLDVTVYYPGQSENLYFCTPVSQGSVTVSMSIFFADGSGFSKLLGSFTPSINTVYKIFCSFQMHIEGELPEEFKDKTVINYKIWFSSNVNGLLKTFHYHYKPSHLTKGSFVFLNCIGGYDTFCPLGVREVSSSVSLDYNNTVIAPGTSQRLYRISGHKTSRIVTQNTGMVTSSQAGWLSQLIFSRRAFWRPISGGSVPISFLENKLDFKEVQSKLYAADIKYIINPILSPESQ